ncbi:hypothetical protein F5Y05DRAFT_281965 [Hypoxylon sp. FL0543]|nr:hypothetical protein F5Y05DRAFT_281965 [Hypoxylon sp. FL0543]
MADYYVWVRDYHWSHHNIVVQSPILDPNAPAPTPIVRPLEGANRNEPRVIDSVAELRDDINKNEYETEAHGVLVSTDPRKPSRFPVWVPVQSYRVKEDEVDIVNLISFTVSNVPIGQICWIPGWEGPGGKLYTVIGAPRLTLRETRVLVLVQSLGRPREAKFVMVKPDELAGYEEIREPRKKRLVEMQSWFIQTRSNPPSTIALNAYRIYCSPYRDNEDRLAFDEILGEDLEDHRSSYSDCSSRSTRSTSCSFSDDGSLYTKPSYPRLVATKVSCIAINCTSENDGIRS